MSLILAADTSTTINTVAVCEASGREVDVLAEIIVACKRRHAERLVETVDWVLAEAGLRLDAMDLLAVSVGPGSFTGLRIGVATWKGLAFASGVPLVGVSTLDALARAGAVETGLVCPLLDARMDEVFGAAYRFTAGGRMEILPARACAVERLLAELDGPAHFLGDGAVRFRARIEAVMPRARFAPAWQSTPRAAAVAAEGWALAEAGASCDPALAAPVYLRKSQAEINREAGVLAVQPGGDEA